MTGKGANCPKCNGPAEHLTANYIQCKWCDRPKKPSAAATRQRLYNCMVCSALHVACPDDVASGYACQHCGGDLLVAGNGFQGINADPNASKVDIDSFISLDWDFTPTV